MLSSALTTTLFTLTFPTFNASQADDFSVFTFVQSSSAGDRMLLISLSQDAKRVESVGRPIRDRTVGDIVLITKQIASFAGA